MTAVSSGCSLEKNYVVIQIMTVICITAEPVLSDHIYERNHLSLHTIELLAEATWMMAVSHGWRPFAIQDLFKTSTWFQDNSSLVKKWLLRRFKLNYYYMFSTRFKCTKQLMLYWCFHFSDKFRLKNNKLFSIWGMTVTNTDTLQIKINNNKQTKNTYKFVNQIVELS